MQIKCFFIYGADQSIVGFDHFKGTVILSCYQPQDGGDVIIDVRKRRLISPAAACRMNRHCQCSKSAIC